MFPKSITHLTEAPFRQLHMNWPGRYRGSDSLGSAFVAPRLVSLQQLSTLVSSLPRCRSGLDKLAHFYSLRQDHCADHAERVPRGVRFGQQGEEVLASCAWTPPEPDRFQVNLTVNKIIPYPEAPCCLPGASFTSFCGFLHHP
jgi:hypothetical protein